MPWHIILFTLATLATLVLLLMFARGASRHIHVTDTYAGLTACRECGQIIRDEASEDDSQRTPRQPRV
jgi:hypothetical protein